MALTGFTRTCGLQSGGGKKVWAAEVADVTSLTFLTPNYTTMTMGTTGKIKLYEFDPDTCELKEDVSIENNCMKVVHGLDFDLTKMSATARTAVEELALASACGLVIIVEDNNGVKWVLGYSENHQKLRPMVLKSAKGTTGKKLNDSNKYTVSLENENNEMMRIFTGAIPA